MLFTVIGTLSTVVVAFLILYLKHMTLFVSIFGAIALGLLMLFFDTLARLGISTRFQSRDFDPEEQDKKITDEFIESARQAKKISEMTDSKDKN